MSLGLIAMENQEIGIQETTERSTTSRYETPTTSRLLLEDNFDSFNESLWKREIKMPLRPVSIVKPEIISESLNKIQ